MTTTAQENPGATELTQLATLISQAVSTLISEYDNAGVTIPNLNSSSHDKSGVSQHPYLSSSEALGNAVKTIGAACAQLSAAVTRPGDVVVNKALSYLESACLKIAVDAKIPDLLLDQPNGVHVDQLAEKSNRDPGKLARVLRTLATNHIFIEVKPNVFANNQLSLKLVSSEPVRAIVEVFTDDSMKAGAFLGDALADPTTAFSYKLEDTAFKRINGASIYEMCAADKTKGERFDQAMVGWSEVTSGPTLQKVYPWSTLSPDTTIVDVGGGNGHAMLEIIRQFPRFKAVIQDTEGAAKDGEQFWSQAYPEALRENRVEFIPFNFLVDSPVEGRDIYYVKHILHNWTNDACLAILSNVRKTMKPTSKLLIHETALQYIVSEHFSRAPKPLLPNYGAASKRLYFADINMMQHFNSQERTVEEFIEMGKKTGFTFCKLWGGGEDGILEFVPAEGVHTSFA